MSWLGWKQPGSFIEKRGREAYVQGVGKRHPSSGTNGNCDFGKLDREDNGLWRKGFWFTDIQRHGSIAVDKRTLVQSPRGGIGHGSKYHVSIELSALRSILMPTCSRHTYHPGIKNARIELVGF